MLNPLQLTYESSWAVNDASITCGATSGHSLDFKSLKSPVLQLVQLSQPPLILKTISMYF